jgi:hypothetical protein
MDEVNIISIDGDKLSTGLVGTFFITAGLMMSERSIERDEQGCADSNWGWAVFGIILFIIGWVMMFSTQSAHVTRIGMFIPIVAIIGQVYFHTLLGYPKEVRQDRTVVTIAIWTVFIGLWLGYLYKLGHGHAQRRAYLWGGFASIVIGMMGYFIFRKSNWWELFGQETPWFAKGGTSMFNTYTPQLSAGFTLFALGNAILY